MGVKYLDYPYITDTLRESYSEKIFETAQRVPGSNVVACGGDFDGDSKSNKPVNSVEAVSEITTIQNNGLFNYDINGNFARTIGRDVTQTMYTFTRDPKTRNKTRDVSDHEFIKYIKNLKDSEISEREVYKYMASYDVKKKPEITLYDTVNITYKGKKITTTVGRLLIMKLVFQRVYEVGNFEFINKPMTKRSINPIFKNILYLKLDKFITGEDINRIIELYGEVGFRLGTVFNPSVTIEMGLTDESYVNFRHNTMDAVRDEIEANGDIELLNIAEDKIIDYAKNKYKDDPMMELFESGSKPSFGNEFKSMHVSLGALPSLTGGKPTIITDALSDKISMKNYPAMVRIGQKGATDRGVKTALGGYQYKMINDGMAGIKGYSGDCGSKEGAVFNTNKADDLMYRFVMNKDGTLTMIDASNVSKYIGKNITIRDVSKCKHSKDGYCSTCIGELPFRMVDSKTVNLGTYLSRIASNVMNLFMKSTHELIQAIYTIENLNNFVYPKPVKPIFYEALDPIDNINKIYCHKDLIWTIPISAVTPSNTSYEVLAHGSILDIDDNGNKTRYSMILGTEIDSSPSEILKTEDGLELDKHIVFKYYAHTPIANNVVTLKKAETVFKMIDSLIRGALSNIVPLELHSKTLFNTFATNEDLNVSRQMIDLLVYTLARDINNPNKPVRETGNSEYRFCAIDDLTVMNGTFSSLMGPDAIRGITISANKTDKEQQGVTTLSEKAFMTY